MYALAGSLVCVSANLHVEGGEGDVDRCDVGLKIRHCDIARESGAFILVKSVLEIELAETWEKEAYYERREWRRGWVELVRG